MVLQFPKYKKNQIIINAIVIYVVLLVIGILIVVISTYHVSRNFKDM